MVVDRLFSNGEWMALLIFIVTGMIMKVLETFSLSFRLGLSKLHCITQLGVAKHSQSSDRTPHNILQVDLESFDRVNTFAKYLLALEVVL